jgi:hypothetical protein
MTKLSKRSGKCGDPLRKKSVAIPVLMIRAASILIPMWQQEAEARIRSLMGDIADHAGLSPDLAYAIRKTGLLDHVKVLKGWTAIASFQGTNPGGTLLTGLCRFKLLRQTFDHVQ